MTAPAAPPARLRVVLYEGGGARPLDAGERARIVRALLDRGYAVSSPGKKGAELPVPRGAGPGDETVVLGRFPRGEPGPWSVEGAGLAFQDLEGLEPAAVVDAVDGRRDRARLPRPGGWKPWFPVIDYSRCTNCMQCLSFCLFDVYGASPEGKIQVRNQTNCKTDCPACSRVCPEVAILFPKYRQGPINGDEINPEDLRREAMKVDISALLGGDIYAALRDRSARAKSRFSKERDEDRALKERQRCLAQLKDKLDIPAEVLASLPSLEQIRAKAEAAWSRAAAAGDSAPPRTAAAPDGRPGEA